MRGRALIDAAERSRRRRCCSGRAASRCAATEVVLVAEGERARDGLGAPGPARAGRARPPGRLPGLDAARRADRRRRPDARQDAAGRARRARRSSPAAARSRSPSRRSCEHYGVNVVARARGRARRPGRRTSCALRRGRARQRARCCATPLRYRAELLRGRVPLRYRRIVVRAEGRERVEAVVHAAVDSRLARGGRQRGARRGRHALRRATGSSRRSSCSGVAGCALRYDEDLGGPVVVVDAWLRTTRPGRLRRRRRHRASQARTSPRTRAGSRRSGSSGTRRAAGADPAAARAQRRRFQRALSAHVPRRPRDLRARRRPDTVVCRCEEVARAELDAAIEATPDINVVKAFTRVTMGLCQGRNCQRQIAALIARAPRTRRSPTSRSRRRARRSGPCRSARSPTTRSRILGLFVVSVTRSLRRRADPRRAPGRDRRAGRRRRPRRHRPGLLPRPRGRRRGRCVERAELNREASGTNAGSFHFQIAIHQLDGARRRRRARAAARPTFGCSLEAARLWDDARGASSTARSTSTSPAA